MKPSWSPDHHYQNPPKLFGRFAKFSVDHVARREASMCFTAHTPPFSGINLHTQPLIKIVIKIILDRASGRFELSYQK